MRRRAGPRRAALDAPLRACRAWRAVLDAPAPDAPRRACRAGRAALDARHCGGGAGPTGGRCGRVGGVRLAVLGGWAVWRAHA
ncbi:hypothetical protein [Alloactinosynnema sp. L-07]|uniref:hypothetical protein n=1 Tax=Alloactinosynnema sp. L-07 TaxID=1653480 RepID=UPI0012F94CBE|nr:hypothetical protein [Alloactinosynnema sp. L-07]